MEEKRELVYELSKSPHGASEMLQSWSRQEILQILCAEMGKERKYTGLTKMKIIENLLKIVSEKKSGRDDIATDPEPHSSPSNGQKPAKRQRKTENPSRLAVPANNVSVNNGGDVGNINTTFCKNSACKATLNQADAFCKRCSCCICHQYDDNKDPSLWLICSSEAPFPGVSCGLSCHLECALKHNGSGIGKDGDRPKLDGGFYCVSCGKVNDLLGCWRKQLMVAKDARRVDVLCYRVSLSQKLLQGTEMYRELHEIVDEAVKKLEPDVGPLTGSPLKIGRGIVNRLSSGPEVQKLCGVALASLDSMLSKRISPLSPNPTVQDASLLAPNMVRFEDVTATSLTVILLEDPCGENNAGYTVWHRKADDVDYPSEPTCTVLLPNRRLGIRGLLPATEYSFQVVSNDLKKLVMCEVQVSTEHGEDEVPNCSATERSQSPVTNCSSLSNPSSVEDETNNSNPYSDQTDNRSDNYPSYHKDSDQLASGNLSNDAINCSGSGGVKLPTVADSLSDKQAAAVGQTSTIPSSDVLKLDNKHSQDEQVTEDVSTDEGLNSPVPTGRECVPLVASSEGGLPNTPCKLEILKDGPGRNGRSKFNGKDLENGSGKKDGPRNGSTSKKRSGERQDEGCTANAFSDRDFEYYVKVIRWLECEGHIEKNFRQKFLTWYGLRASTQEVRIVKIYVDTFLEDPASLAEQLVDTFSECISSSRTSVVPAGFCMKLWH
ncbi:VIN3-like protein 2 isoform X2 [Cicer arietinum]|nr:VIN3-like protein 2 isoform X2 [Cicer arietinum]